MTSHMRNQLMEGRAARPRVGSVVQLETQHPPYAVFGPDGEPVDPVTAYLRALAPNDDSPGADRNYAHDLLRWFRFLWLLEVPWDKATEGEVAMMAGWLRAAPNPQRRRSRASAPEPGSVDPVHIAPKNPPTAASWTSKTPGRLIDLVDDSGELLPDGRVVAAHRVTVHQLAVAA